MRRLWEIAGDSVRSHLEGDVYAEPAARVDRALAAPAEDAVDDDVLGRGRRRQGGRVSLEEGEPHALLHQVAERLVRRAADVWRGHAEPSCCARGVAERLAEHQRA